MSRRLAIGRAELDDALVETGTDLLNTFLKDVTHARHDGVGAVFSEIASHLSAGPDKGRAAAPPPLDKFAKQRAIAEQEEIVVGETKYVHIDPGPPPGKPQPFDDEQCRIIAAAQLAQQESVRLPDVVTHVWSEGAPKTWGDMAGSRADLSGWQISGAADGSDGGQAGATRLRFEVRFGEHAVSARWPEPPPSGIIQVNLDNDNTRIVERLPRES